LGPAADDSPEDKHSNIERRKLQSNPRISHMAEMRANILSLNISARE